MAKAKSRPDFLPALRQKAMVFTDSSMILERAMKEFEGIETPLLESPADIVLLSRKRVGSPGV